ncbi:hypothetical protein HG536_0D00670 [Torulaspora globosa]|uniref:Uncharacterized protein n=1 Tax=Torulaspora globosa TaxID=48254 RepID=A0A7G3ZGA9_9SACH|nr:uncharacterized protein HG536_0D00670 [Torulaspora globosa]QLL32545.1 hypothetical protein HG536_0D00670 [Torulaspora globosa]
MSELDFRSLSNQVISGTGMMHHQTKLDVFIIRAYKLLSSGSIINSNTLQSVTNSPQTTSATPAGSSATNVSSSVSSQNGGSGNNNVNTTNGMGPNNSIRYQYSQLFGKISKLYNATISTGAIDDRSTSPKSAIELYQRFQQIIKELELSYEVSPYSRYFQRLDQGLWQIRDDVELKSDRLWDLVSASIFSTYDPRTGQIITQGRRKTGGSLAASTKGSPTELLNNTGNNSSTINKPQANMAARNETVNPTLNSMMMDASLPQQLQRRLQTISQDINSRSLNGYYTQPTSPGQGGGYGFGLDNDATLYNPSTFSNTNAGTSWKRRSLGSLAENALDDEAVEELLQLTNTTKRQRTETPVNLHNAATTGAVANAANNLKTRQTNEHTSGPIMNSTATNVSRSATTIPPTMNDFTNSTATNNTMNPVNDNLTFNDSMNNALVAGDTLVRQLKDTYDTLVSEKNQRIIQLEREVELQRQETQWLRKMLIEDMGCVRSLLKDLRR